MVRTLKLLWKSLKLSFVLSIILTLILTNVIIGSLLYEKATGKMPLIGLPRSEPLLTEPKATETLNKAPSSPKKNSVLLDAPLINQMPELYNGCEITSLAMLLQFFGINKDKMELAREMKKDPTPMKTDAAGNITYWGNPTLGFVGDVKGKDKGYSIYHTALFDVLKTYISTAVDLTNQSFESLEQQIDAGIPVVVWTTIDYVEPKRWVIWDSPAGPVRATFSVHSVLLVGYDQKYVYVNDPLSSVKGKRVDKQQFIRSWEALGKQALSYTPSHQ